MSHSGSTVRKLWYEMRSSWHYGRGGKFTQRGNHETALKHFLIALEAARIGSNEGVIAVELECVARTFIRLKKPIEARSYAEEALDLYGKLTKNSEDLFSKGVRRVEALIAEGRID